MPCSITSSDPHCLGSQAPAATRGKAKEWGRGVFVCVCVPMPMYLLCVCLRAWVFLHCSAENYLPSQAACKQRKPLLDSRGMTLQLKACWHDCRKKSECQLKDLSTTQKTSAALTLTRVVDGFDRLLHLLQGCAILIQSLEQTQGKREKKGQRVQLRIQLKCSPIHVKAFATVGHTKGGKPTLTALLASLAVTIATGGSKETTVGQDF